MASCVHQAGPGSRPGQGGRITDGLRWLCGRLAAVLFALCLAAPVGVAQETAPEPESLIDTVAGETRLVELTLEQGRLSASRIEEFRATLEQRRKELQDEVESVKAAIEPLRAELEALGAAPTDGATEAPEIATKRADLQERIAPLDARLKQLQVAQTQVLALADRLIEFRRDRFTREILERQPTPVSPERVRAAWESVKTRSLTIVREIQARAKNDGSGVLIDQLGLPLFLALCAFALAFWLRRRLIRWIRGRVDHEETPARRARLTAIITLVRLILPSIGVGLVVVGLRQSGLMGPNGMVLTVNVAIAAFCLIAAYAFGGAFFGPRSRGLRVSGLSDWRATSGYRWYVLLAFVLAADQLLVAAGKDLRLTVDALSVINAVLLVLGGFALWHLVRAIGLGVPARDHMGAVVEDERRRSTRITGAFARLILSFTAVVSPLLALVGYFAASRFLFFPTVYTASMVGAAIVIYLWVRAISEPPTADSDAPDGEAEEADAKPPSLSVLPVIAGFTLTLLALPLLAIIWGARATDLSSAWALIVEGFQVGDITISPMDFVIFGIVFAIGYLITRALQGVLRRSVMPVVRIDDGAKAALLAGIGYIGIVISALVAISTTALDLSNLAIVAGALSVGIGFGLQNVVNNFVSGIILLIERPIKVGDWVEVGGQHGMVRRINVRSTQIQRFDRSTMFVPNADLISGTVTNWYHGEGQGQLKLAVGVAYGSDVRKVEQILLDAAKAHPMVLRTPAPFVIFKEFGASSLDFELRGVMADVNMILTLPSELRYSIYRRFNEEGIEIPFAQRDITIRNLHELMDQRDKGAVDDTVGE